MSDAELYRRGRATLLASWQEYARAAPGARLARLPGVSAAVFPHEPERAVYNNALLDRAEAVEAMEDAYRAAGVTYFTAWVHETDRPLREALERRGYTVHDATRAMGLALDEFRLPRPERRRVALRDEVELGPADWAAYLRHEGLPPEFLRGADHAAFHVLAARLDGGIVAAALAYDHDGDCGIYNVGTAEPARRRGLGTALVAAQLHAAAARGCRTASLQSTAMAERMYAAAGFRDLGRILEYGLSPVKAA